MAALPQKGESLCGFTATETARIHMPEAETVSFCHAASGAQLLYIHNDDRELGFSLIYRTPQPDETDACHMLEHLALCSCRRYPSRDIFFDMDSTSFSTFMNGVTDNVYTCYPVCSCSEEQLLRLMDVFLCCMEEPEGLRDENFFLREGIRFELDAAEGPLTMSGTVLSEDWAHLTDILENADACTARALWPDHPASLLLGRAHLHYRDISLARVREVFRRCYAWDNCLIVLYGDLNLVRVLEFLDREHLGRGTEQAARTALSARARGLIARLRTPVPAGFRRLTCESPAYNGSRRENEAVIDYAIDLSHASQEELVWWELFAGILDHDNSPLHAAARAAGLTNVIEVYLDSMTAAPALKFRLHNGNAGQQEALMEAARTALREVKENGLAPRLYAASMKENRLADGLTREGEHLGFALASEVARCWSLTGRCDYLALYENAFAAFEQDGVQQLIVRRLAASALSPRTSALTLTVPAPGLAEELEQARDRFLAERLAAMDAAQRSLLIAETAAFRAWNEMALSNRDFLIPPERLPQPAPTPQFQQLQAEGIRFMMAPAPTGALGSYQLFFDLSGLPQEDWNYLALYQLLLTEVDTARHSVREQKTLEQELLHDCIFDELYPDERAGEAAHPMMSVSWFGLTEDFAAGLDFLLDLMGGGDYSDGETILRVVEKYLPDYDLSKADTAPSLAYSLAESAIRRSSRFRYLLNSPGLYRFLSETADRLRAELEGGAAATPPAAPAAAAPVSCLDALAGKLRSTAAAVLTRHRLVFLAAADARALPHLKASALRALSSLPDAGPQTASPALPSFPSRLAACVDAPAQEVRMLGDFLGEARFKGRFLPFWLAAGDRCLKPAVRYRGGAYDCGIDFFLPEGYFTLWSTADPSVPATLTAFRSAGRMLEALKLTRQDLDGYILNASSLCRPPSGALAGRMRAMRRRLFGIDEQALAEQIADIRRATLADQKEAARLLDELLAKAAYSVVGNDRAIRAAAGRFDQIITVSDAR